MTTPFEKFQKDYQGKKVLIMGLGLQGRGVSDALFFHKIGAKVKVTDLKTEKELASSLEKLQGLAIEYTLGAHKKEDFENIDLVLRNAAVPRSSPFLTVARKNKIKISMDEALFAEYFPGEMVGITGTRGKTTTTTLIYEVLKAAKKDVFLAGNILGRATLPLLEKVKENSLVILELSSWQLQGFEWIKFSPHVAVITNIYEDHLNRYKNMAEYIEDKKVIFKYQNKNDLLVLNEENKIIKGFAKKAKSQVTFFNKKDVPLDWQLKIPGEHNKENVAAVLKVAEIYKIPQEWVKAVVTIFQGIPFRQELIAKINGVAFINDTTSTTPIASIKALETVKGKIILLAGGASKNLDLTEFAKKIVAQARGVVLLEGTATDNLEKLIISHGSKDKILGRFDDFEKAVKLAFEKAKPGGVVLLSPGCASFGMFKNEFDRGRQFNELVKELKDDHP